MQQPLAPRLPQQQQEGQSDNPSSSTTSSNTADTVTNDESPLGETTESMEDLFG